MQPFSNPMLPTTGPYDALAPLREAVLTYTSAAIDLCAPHGLRPTCGFSADATGLHMDIEVRDKADRLHFTAMGTDPLADLARQLPHVPADAFEAQRASLAYLNRAGTL